VLVGATWRTSPSTSSNRAERVAADLDECRGEPLLGAAARERLREHLADEREPDDEVVGPGASRRMRVEADHRHGPAVDHDRDPEVRLHPDRGHVGGLGDGLGRQVERLVAARHDAPGLELTAPPRQHEGKRPDGDRLEPRDRGGAEDPDRAVRQELGVGGAVEAQEGSEPGERPLDRAYDLARGDVAEGDEQVDQQPLEREAVVVADRALRARRGAGDRVLPRPGVSSCHHRCLRRGRSRMNVT